MARNLILEEITKKINKRGRQDFRSKWGLLFDYELNEEEGNDEDYNDVQYVDLVYPPNSNPPNRHSIKKMNLIGFNQISIE